MTSVNFCDACRETLWLELLAKVSLIDGIRAEENSRNGTITISLDLMPFGHLRQPRPIAGEQLLTTWYRVVSSVDPGVHQPQFDNMHEWTAPAGWSRGMWRADVELVTPEVRRDDDGLLRDSIFIRIE
ncbi:hypothetical protein H696_02723 [Fonticula alba]|uniref:Uncharacterized protein n=1 Tax=Fonticula alba TaxID=691883 RepID=A0A058ZA30_FONAL|nr:hypothetical protein H696_02723 [Fonticula alba]KCV70387.1 hypothetical protein H696_02723 [Fonticula alba]|eukprot:XP_009494903.1 hypothetical protein H696_02723 [Fonticula alba]